MKKISTIEEKIKKLMKKEDRKDAEFRYAIMTTEIGDLGKYITHDPKLNPNARPHGTREDEILAYGQAFVQLAALTQLRNISLEDAITKGLENWTEADWRKSKAKEKETVTGITACHGHVIGEAYVARTRKEAMEMPKGKILVVRFAKPDWTEYFSNALAAVSDHGGKTCHLANIARELGMPCIVGTGNATSLIESGQQVIVDATGDKGKIILKETQNLYIGNSNHNKHGAGRETEEGKSK